MLAPEGRPGGLEFQHLALVGPHGNGCAYPIGCIGGPCAHCQDDRIAGDYTVRGEDAGDPVAILLETGDVGVADLHTQRLGGADVGEGEAIGVGLIEVFKVEAANGLGGDAGVDFGEVFGLGPGYPWHEGLAPLHGLTVVFLVVLVEGEV